MGVLAGVEKFTGFPRLWETDFVLRVRPNAMGISSQSAKTASIQNRTYVSYPPGVHNTFPGSENIPSNAC